MSFLMVVMLISFLPFPMLACALAINRSRGYRRRSNPELALLCTPASRR